MAQNNQGVWRVKLVGKFPVSDKSNKTNALFDDVSKSLCGASHYSDEIFNSDAVKQLVTGNASFASFKSQVATVGKKVTDMIQAGTLTQAKAQEGVRKAVERANERLEQANVSDKTEMPSDEKSLDLTVKTIFSKLRKRQRDCRRIFRYSVNRTLLARTRRFEHVPRQNQSDKTFARTTKH